MKFFIETVLISCLMIFLCYCSYVFVEHIIFSYKIPDSILKECAEYREKGIAENYTYCPEYWNSYNKH